ncbi:MAG: hypothetical protein LBQ06_05250 [Frankiaceae bacterium]|jgi:hypothetical protein|nr:hypothetical protein [Frankiaceae bacterium]
MIRRTSLPGAAELFRTTGSGAPAPEPVATLSPLGEADPEPAPVAAVAALLPPSGAEPPGAPPGPARAVRQTGRRIRPAVERTPSGRERHEEKITVYCSAEELVDLESARLALRAEQGLAVDRGRIVREAIAVVLADFEAKGDASILVRRLRDA